MIMPSIVSSSMAQDRVNYYSLACSREELIWAVCDRKQAPGNECKRCPEWEKVYNGYYSPPEQEKAMCRALAEEIIEFILREFHENPQVEIVLDDPVGESVEDAGV